jgi:hypothetical protein
MTAEAFAVRAHTIPYVRKGVWYSEIYLFLSCCLNAGVTLVVESGVKYGMSTRLLAATFGGPVISIDRDFEIEAPERVHFIAGDVQEILPRVLAEARRQTIGLLIDGPKDAIAIALKDAAFMYPHVAVVGVHDLDASCGADFHSHAEGFRATYGRALDLPVIEPYASKYPDGPGIGVWVRRAA